MLDRLVNVTLFPSSGFAMNKQEAVLYRRGVGIQARQSDCLDLIHCSAPS